MGIYDRLVSMGFRPYRYRPPWGQTRWRVDFVCASCGKECSTDFNKVLYREFSRKCYGCSRVFRNKGKEHYNWKGGRFVGSQGYVFVKLSEEDPMYVMANKNGYVKESRIVVARNMGRALTRMEEVHHVDGNRKNNALENLVVMDHEEHMSLESKLIPRDVKGRYKKKIKV